MNTTRYSRVVTGFLVGGLATAAAAMCIFLSGCPSTSQRPAIQEAGKIVADCGEPAVHDLATHALDDVASALVSADYSGGMRDVAGRIAMQVSGALISRASEVAWAAVKCGATELFEQTGAHLRFGSLDRATAEREQLMRQNASAWLAAH